MNLKYPTVICITCTASNRVLTFVEPVEIDLGIGSYECHGYSDVDVFLLPVCPICETDHFLDAETFEEVELSIYDVR